MCRLNPTSGFLQSGLNLAIFIYVHITLIWDQRQQILPYFNSLRSSQIEIHLPNHRALVLTRFIRKKWRESLGWRLSNRRLHLAGRHDNAIHALLKGFLGLLPMSWASVLRMGCNRGSKGKSPCSRPFQGASTSTMNIYELYWIVFSIASFVFTRGFTSLLGGQSWGPLNLNVLKCLDPDS